MKMKNHGALRPLYNYEEGIKPLEISKTFQKKFLQGKKCYLYLYCR